MLTSHTKRWGGGGGGTGHSTYTTEVPLVGRSGIYINV